jgi:hypothetical protein
MTEKDLLNGNLDKLYQEGYALSEDETQYLSSWGSLAMQIREAEESLNLSIKFGKKRPFGKFEEFILANALYKNSILAYAKCFSNSGKGKISLDSNQVYANSSKHKEIHDKLMGIRNEYVAHNDNNDFELAIVLQKQEKDRIIISNTVSYNTPVDDFNQYLELFKYCSIYIINQVNKKADKLEKRLGKRIDFR